MDIQPIAYIETDFDSKFGIPRQSGRVPSLRGTITFCREYRVAEALRGIEQFSHLWLIFDFSLAHRDNWSPTVRPPRLGGNTRVGVFASRSPFRPNHLGLSVVKLDEVKMTPEHGLVLLVSGVDLLNGTPIFDIKPYIPFADCIPHAVAGYADRESGHRLSVHIPDSLLAVIPQEKREALIDCLADDPHPSYQHDPRRKYCLDYAGYAVSFTVCDDILTVDDIQPKR